MDGVHKQKAQALYVAPVYISAARKLSDNKTCNTTSSTTVLHHRSMHVIQKYLIILVCKYITGIQSLVLSALANPSARVYTARLVSSTKWW